MSGIKIANGTAASAEQTVDTDGNAHVTLPTTMAQAGYAALLGVMDEGTVTGARESLELEPTADYRLRVGIDQILFSECFPGTVMNTSIWQAPSTTMTTAVGTAWMTLNAANNTATNIGCALLTRRFFTAEGAAGLSMRWRGQLSQAAQVGNVVEMGMFYPVTGVFVFNPAVAPIDGVFFRIDAAQNFKCVASVAGVETESAALNLATLVGTGVHDYAIDVTANNVNFWIDDVLVAGLLDATGAVPSATMALPVCFRLYNTGVTAAAQTLKVGNVQVVLADIGGTYSAGEYSASSGRSASQTPTGHAIGQPALWPNVAAPTAAAAPTNTTAALGSGLGGIFQELMTLTAGTDGIISSYQVPLATAALPGKTLMVTGVTVDSAVVVSSATAIGARAWAVAYGHTAVSLLTVDGATAATPTKGPRRLPLGCQGVIAAVAVGAQLQRVGGPLATPIIVNPGEFIQVVVKNQIAGAALSHCQHVVKIEGYSVLTFFIGLGIGILVTGALARAEKGRRK